MTQQVEYTVDVNEVSPVLRELKFEIPWKTVQSQMDQKLGELKRKARPIKGFRKGKTPKWLLKQMFGPQVEAEVAQDLINETLMKALIEHKLAPVATPEIDPEKLEDGQPLAFTARVEVRPEIEEIKWEGLELKRTVYEVKNEEVDGRVEQLREEHASLRTPAPARPAETGDVLLIDYEVKLEGKEEPERTQTDYEVELGKGMLLEDVEKSLVGLSPGDQKVVDVDMPEMPGSEEGEKKKIVFDIKVKEVKEKILPELDDEFAKDVSEHETLLELRLSIRKSIEKELEQQSENALKDTMLDVLCDENPIEIPPTLIDQQLQETQNEMSRMLGMDMSKNPFNEEQLGRMRDQGERKIRAGLLLTELSEKEKLEVSDEEFDERLKEIAEQAGQPLPKIKAQFGKDGRIEQLRFGMLQQKVVEHILSKANVTDVPHSEQESSESEESESTSESE